MTPKTKSIIQLITICLLTVAGLVLSFVSFAVPGVNNYRSLVGSIRYGNDLDSGIVAVYEVKPLEEGNYTDFDKHVDDTMKAILSLLSSKGHEGATATRQGSRQIRIEVPNTNDPKQESNPTQTNDPKQVFEAINSVGEVFVSHLSDVTAAKADTENTIRGRNILNVFVLQQTGQDGNPTWGISIVFDATGKERLKDMTTNHDTIYIHRGNTSSTNGMAIEPVENGRLFLTFGTNTKETAEITATSFLAGTFMVQLERVQNENISPALGYGALRNIAIAGVVGIVIIFLLMIAIYKGFGLSACLALLVEVVLLLFFFATLPFIQLTLPSIAGILLALAMTVDGQIAMFERIKEEFRTGKKMKMAMADGYKRSVPVVFDKTIITFVVALVLFLAGSGVIKTFAATLVVGVVVSLFTQLVMTRWLMAIMMRIVTKKEKFYGLKRLPKKELTGGNTNGK